MQNKIDRPTWGRGAMSLAVGSAAALALMLAVVAVLLSGRAETASAQAPETTATEEQRLAGETFQRTELYFGSEKQGPDVTEKQFDRFVDEEVTPKFPDGLTLLTGYGQFKGSNGKIVQEQSFVLVLLYPPDDKAANGEIQEIRNTYKEDFDQESVLRTDSRERVSF